MKKRKQPEHDCTEYDCNITALLEISSMVMNLAIQEYLCGNTAPNPVKQLEWSLKSILEQSRKKAPTRKKKKAKKS